MRIYAMTATFGKLEHQTLSLQPGLNIIEAPNEWGKSTWCAFLAAMFYGIETRPHSTKTALADKERYAPWSGSPMAGRIDLCWKGRNITIERKTRGRSVFGEFQAYETESGFPVPELTAANCGTVLLGVERSVFLRSAFLRLTDMPVTQDEALRRRLNALVTTGDENGDADHLAQKLRELKNRCRFNRMGLLPQAESQENDLTRKIAELQGLQTQVRQIESRQSDLKQYRNRLQNHLDALSYEAAKEMRQRIARAEAGVREAREQLELARLGCSELPSRDEAQQKADRLQQLRGQLLDLQAESIPQTPTPPEGPAAFQGLSGREAMEQAEADEARLHRARSKTLPLVFFCAGLVALLACIWALSANHTAVGWVLGIICGAAFLAALGQSIRRHRLLAILKEKYGSSEPQHWLNEAAGFAARMHAYTQALSHRQEQEASLAARREDLLEQLREETSGKPLDSCFAYWQRCLEAHSELSRCSREYEQALAHAEALSAMAQSAEPPAQEDTLTFTQEDTNRILLDIGQEQHRLQLHLGQALGRMDQLGSMDDLRRQLEDVKIRIDQLEDTYAALVLAQETLSDARAELQRRFAPRITRHARELFSQLTDGRYDRLTLDEAMNLQAGTGEEGTLRSSLWRSDGTVDQLYLALRLAVARELVPNVPLVLDDALVRFDNTRLRAAMKILQQEADTRQVLLFTCQNREKQMLS